MVHVYRSKISLPVGSVWDGCLEREFSCIATLEAGKIETVYVPELDLVIDKSALSPDDKTIILDNLEVRT